MGGDMVMGSLWGVGGRHEFGGGVECMTLQKAEIVLVKRMIGKSLLGMG